MPLAWGDSTGQDVGDGGDGSIAYDGTVYGDTRGDPVSGNVGHFGRFVCDFLKRPFVNLCRASNGARYDAISPDYMVCRKQLVTYLGVSDIIFGHAINDVGNINIAGATVFNWGASTAYKVGHVRKNSSKWYYCVQPGTSASSGGPTTTVTTDITDGTCKWRYLWPSGVGADDIMAPEYAYQKQIRDALPNARTYQITCLMGSTSTDQWRTLLNQSHVSAYTNYSPMSNTRGVYNKAVRDNNRLAVTKVLDLGLTGMEYGFSKDALGNVVESGKWQVSPYGAWNLYCDNSGGHLNSYGSYWTAYMWYLLYGAELSAE